MASQTTQQEIHYCAKCGGLMISRMIAEKNGSEKPILIKILQCKVCRYWKRV